jgi:hypothetical protein
MPAYEICYRDDHGALTYKFSADCDALIYARPSAVVPMRAAS